MNNYYLCKKCNLIITIYNIGNFCDYCDNYIYHVSYHHKTRTFTILSKYLIFSQKVTESKSFFKIGRFKKLTTFKLIKSLFK